MSIEGRRSAHARTDATGEAALYARWIRSTSLVD
jgi:hypothetical protein